MSYFLRSVLATEATLEKGYFGEFKEAVKAAEAAGESVLLAGCALPVDERRALFADWRNRAMGAALVEHREFHQAFQCLPGEIREKAGRGELPLREIENAARELAAEVAALIRGKEIGNKTSLRTTLVALHHDPASVRQNSVPNDLVILADGSVHFCANYREAKTVGRGSGQPWFHAPIDVSRARFVQPEPMTFEEAAAAVLNREAGEDENPPAPEAAAGENPAAEIPEVDPPDDQPAEEEPVAEVHPSEGLPGVLLKRRSVAK